MEKVQSSQLTTVTLLTFSLTKEGLLKVIVFPVKQFSKLFSKHKAKFSSVHQKAIFSGSVYIYKSFSLVAGKTLILSVS